MVNTWVYQLVFWNIIVLPDVLGRAISYRVAGKMDRFTEICKMAYRCDNGRCVIDFTSGHVRKIFCECEDGFTGIFCHYKCPPCVHGQCINNGHRSLCECDSGYAGVLCADIVENTTTTELFSNLTPSVDKIGDLNTMNQNIPAANNSVIDTSKDQTKRCGNNFVCKNGYCDIDSTVSNKYKCVCLTGWAGLFCEIPCTRDCGMNGNCIVTNNSEEYCECKSGYTGEHCGTVTENNMI